MALFRIKGGQLFSKEYVFGIYPVWIKIKPSTKRYKKVMEHFGRLKPKTI